MVRKSSSTAVCAMSPYTRSKPESPTSRGDGDAPDVDPPKGEARDVTADTVPESPKGKDKPLRKGGNVEVKLEVSRQRPIGWTIFGLIVGALLVWKLGTVGKWVGVVLMLIGAFRAYQLVQTFLHPPGTI